MLDCRCRLADCCLQKVDLLARQRIDRDCNDEILLVRLHHKCRGSIVLVSQVRLRERCSVGWDCKPQLSDAWVSKSLITAAERMYLVLIMNHVCVAFDEYWYSEVSEVLKGNFVAMTWTVSGRR